MVSRRFLVGRLAHHHRRRVFPPRRLPRTQPTTPPCARRTTRKLDALRAEVRTQLGKARAPEVVPAATMGGDASDGPSRDGAPAVRARMVAEIKRELQSEMGLLPVPLLRDRRSSFVELYSTDNFGQDQLRHRRLSRRRLLRHRQARGRRAEGRGRPAEHAQDRRRSRSCTRARRFRRSSSTPATPTSKCTAATGRSSRPRELDLPALQLEHVVRLRLRRADLPPRQRLLEGHHPVDRLRRPADVERPGHLPDRRPSGRVGRRRARSARRSGRHPDRPDAGRLSLLVHPADARRDAPQGSRPRLESGRSTPSGRPRLHSSETRNSGPMLRDFRDFLFKQNALALAVGVIIGAAIGRVVQSIVSDLLMPVIGLGMPGGDWRDGQDRPLGDGRQGRPAGRQRDQLRRLSRHRRSTSPSSPSSCS